MKHILMVACVVAIAIGCEKRRRPDDDNSARAPINAEKPKEVASKVEEKAVSRKIDISEDEPIPNRQPEIAPSPRRKWVKEAFCGLIGVSLDDPKIEKVRIKTTKGVVDSPHEFLVLKLFVGNVSKEKKNTYIPWESTTNGVCSLMDDLGNTYKMQYYQGGMIEGQIRASQSIYPEKWVEDILVFETPVSAAKILILDLDAKNVGETGRFKFEFPAPK